MHYQHPQVNPHDQKSRDTGLFTKDSLPAVLANDVVGEIVKLGPHSTRDYQVGDHIFAQSNAIAGIDHGGLQEYCLLDVEYSCKVPSNINDDQAATIPTNMIAPYIAFFTPVLGLVIPETDAAKAFDFKPLSLLVVGGGSNCGKFGVQLAKWAGIGQIIVVAGKDNEAQLKQLGATHVIDRHGADVLGEIRKLTGDDLIYAYDAVNRDNTLAVAALSNTKKGTLATLVHGQPDTAKIGEKKAGYEVKGVFGLSMAYPEAAGLFWRKFMPEWLESGAVSPLDYKVIEGLNADKVNAVYDNYRDGMPQSKVHVHP